ncbi:MULTISPECIES: MarR family winged helix-turn-helix transcriptional regulator [Kitasatospora]|jgi:DNA-binding MarR family transcriptional regulator|uniref:HTH marR-type domain-containing protein n=1 Tax=Kitasatospora arboriphila TaxID=258052 RepID=A0ABP4EPI3_9ACTN
MSTGTPSTQAADAADLTGDFGFSLLVLARAYQSAVALVLDDVPQGARGYQVLSAVVRGDHPSQLALATYLGIDRTVMTYLVDDLVAAGLVERRLNPGDRRQRRIVATARGVDALQSLRKRVREAEDRLLGALDDSECQAFRGHLARVACDVRDVDPVSEACEAATGLCD